MRFLETKIRHTRQCTNSGSKEKDAKLNSDKCAKVIDSRSLKVLKLKVLRKWQFWIKVRKLKILRKLESGSWKVKVCGSWKVKVLMKVGKLRVWTKVRKL